MTTPFLTARWQDLVLLNWECPRETLAPLVPEGTELDPWEGRHMVSLVGFRFVDTRVRGIAVPGHRTFEEVNLRFYVRRREADGVRRAVVFVRELVPRRAIAGLARWLYNEPYRALPMRHRVDLAPERGGSAEYGWTWRGAEHAVHASVSGPAALPQPGSEAEFVTEHYWGYTRQRDGGTIEYRVEHPRWRVWEAAVAGYRGPGMSDLYGADLSALLKSTPRSAFVALGGEVAVHPGERLPG